jgi:phosphoglycerate dehydrogenase-like enzyme
MPTSVVLVTETEFRRAKSTFSDAGELQCVPVPGNEDALCDAIVHHGTRLIVVGSAPYRGRLYSTLPRGGVIARFGVGYDNVDLPQASAAGLLCTNTPDVLQQSVAELTMTMIGAAARHVVAAAPAVRAGRWEPKEGFELEGKTLALIGTGAIATAVARIASGGFGMRVIGYARTPRERPSPHYAAITADFAEAVRDADVVSLHLPGSPENLRFMNGERLALLPARAWLVNTARGAVVDEVALHQALASGRLAGAALDVFAREPYQPADAAHDLRALDNVILVPHIGSNTVEANRRMALRALRNVRLAIAGDLGSMDVLNREVLPLGGTIIKDSRG